ncbi:MAG: LuxR C-terminal-related transcriptional regulator [Anaerolineales bacterium]|jgi:DNA-binding CsgD family transcriptional regulator
MPTSGFSIIWRSVGRFFRRTDPSAPGYGERGQYAGAPDPEALVDALDEETSEMLAKLAERERVDAYDYALDLLRYTIRFQYRESDQRITRWKDLTGREQEVAALVCRGKTNQEIAAKLCISEETVKKHVSSVLRKFEVKGRGILKWMLDDWGFENPEKPWESQGDIGPGSPQPPSLHPPER